MSTTPRSDVTTQITSVPVEDFLSTVTKEGRLADARQVIEIMRRVSGD